MNHICKVQPRRSHRSSSGRRQRGSPLQANTGHPPAPITAQCAAARSQTAAHAPLWASPTQHACAAETKPRLDCDSARDPIRVRADGWRQAPPRRCGPAEHLRLYYNGTDSPKGTRYQANLTTAVPRRVLPLALIPAIEPSTAPHLTVPYSRARSRGCAEYRMQRVVHTIVADRHACPPARTHARTRRTRSQNARHRSGWHWAAAVLRPYRAPFFQQYTPTPANAMNAASARPQRFVRCVIGTDAPRCAGFSHMCAHTPGPCAQTRTRTPHRTRAR